MSLADLLIASFRKSLRFRNGRFFDLFPDGDDADPCVWTTIIRESKFQGLEDEIRSKDSDSASFRVNIEPGESRDSEDVPEVGSDRRCPRLDDVIERCRSGEPHGREDEKKS